MNSWCRFFLKCIVFIALLLLVDLGMGKLFVLAKDFALSNHPDDMWLKSSYVIEDVKSDILIIGSSTAAHNYNPQLIEEGTGLSTYNGGQDGCFFLYNACTINSLLERYHPRVMVWDLNPHGLLDSDGGDEYQNMRYLSYYYDDDRIVKDYIDSRESKIKYLFHINGYKYNSHFIYTFYPLIHYSSSQKGYTPLYSDDDKVIEKKEMTWDGRWVEKEIQELKKTVDCCKEKGVKLIVVTSPYYAQFDNKVERYCDEFSILLKDNDVQYINLLYMEPFINDPTLFRDRDHLNVEGSNLMTEILIDRINTVIKE